MRTDRFDQWTPPRAGATLHAVTFVEAADAWAVGPTTFTCSACAASIDIAAGVPVDRCPGCGRFPLLRRGVVPPVARAELAGWTALGVGAALRHATASDAVEVHQAIADPFGPAVALIRSDDDIDAVADAPRVDLWLRTPDAEPESAPSVSLVRDATRTAIRGELDLGRWFAVGFPADRTAALGDRMLRLAAAFDAQTLGLIGAGGPLGLLAVRADLPGLPSASDCDLLGERGDHRLLGSSRLLAEPGLPAALAPLLAC